MNAREKLRKMKITVKDDGTVEEDIKWPEIGDPPFLRTLSFVEEDEDGDAVIKAFPVGGGGVCRVSVDTLYEQWEQEDLEIGFYGWNPKEDN